jgi:Fic family protein
MGKKIAATISRSVSAALSRREWGEFPPGQPRHLTKNLTYTGLMGILVSMSYQPQFAITPALLARAERIAALRERILAATVQVPWIPALQKDTRTRNTHSSTAIEGNPLTLEQVRAVEEGREIPAVAQRAKREVTNYFSGLRFIETQSSKKSISHEDGLSLRASL